MPWVIYQGAPLWGRTPLKNPLNLTVWKCEVSCRDFEILKWSPTSLEFQAQLLVCAFASPARLVFCINMSWSVLSGLGFFTSEILQHRPQCNSSLWELWLPKFQPSLEFPGRICEPDIHQGEDWALHTNWLQHLSPCPSPWGPVVQSHTSLWVPGK